jgi:hypothetical protein
MLLNLSDEVWLLTLLSNKLASFTEGYNEYNALHIHKTKNKIRETGQKMAEANVSFQAMQCAIFSRTFHYLTHQTIT